MKSRRAQLSCDAVIFDLFGTLVDDFRTDTYRTMLQGMSGILGVPVADFERLWRATMQDRMVGAFPTIEACLEHICAACGTAPSAAEVGRATEQRVAITRAMLVPRPDAIATLRALKERGLRLGLISNCTPELSQLWPETEFAPLFDATILSASIGLKKPDPRIYLLACERLGVTPQRCLYVGDNSDDELQGAAAVGMEAVRIRTPEQAAGDAGGKRGRWEGKTISALSEVPSLV